MRLGRRTLLGLAATLAIASLAGCTATPPPLAAKITPVRGGSVTEAIVGAPGTLNPLMAQDASARDVDSLIYQGLTAVDAHQRAVPLLASGWTVSGDRLTYTFTLRKGVRWADGRPLTVDDVLFTFEVLQDPTYTQGANAWQSIKVQRAGPSQVEFTLKAPSNSFPFLLTIGILPAHVFRSGLPSAVLADPHSGPEAFGTGPFMVQSISEDHTAIRLKRNPYAVPAPYLDHFVFRAYPTLSGAVNAVVDGAADAVGGVQPPQVGSLGGRSDLTVHSAGTFQQMAMVLDLSPRGLKLFDPPPVRQALNQAIDRAAIIRDVLGGQAEPAMGPIPPSNWAYSAAADRQLRYDPNAARAELDAAGWTLPAGGRVRQRGGISFTAALVTPDAYPYLQVATEVRRQLAAVGMSVVLDEVPSSILVGRYLIPRQYQMALAQLDSGPDADQSAFWHSGQPDGSLNFAPLPHQALIDKDLDDAEAAAGQAAQRGLYDDFQSLVAQAAPAVFIYEPRYLYLVSTRVRGVSLKPVIEPSDRFQDVAGWYVMSTGG